jgi:hypothetical protein
MLKKTKYPIYIISKGRWEKRLTSKALEKLNVEYRIVIEPQEYENYAKFIDNEKILVLPFSNLGQGSIPARNWVWEHSINEGHKKHWILDDNMPHFLRLNNSIREYCHTPAIFLAAEDFIDRYKNIALSGFNYMNFAGNSSNIPPYRLNTRIYSCILINNDIPYRWRGKYNEDTDLSIRALKDGWCTMLFNAFLVDKTGTMRDRGGNTDSIYNTGDNRYEFAKSLYEQHPDIVKIVNRYNRWHHQVDYSVFKNNKLIKKDNLNIENKVNNYGMVLKNLITNI